jgi:two-component system, sensor histidine kinase
MRFVLRWWKSIPIARKLYFVVGTMATLILCELLILKFSIGKISAVRAFVEGEALWSKSQKNAYISLRQYRRSKDEKDYQAYLDYLKVPEGDHIARMELIKPDPNIDEIRRGFIQGRIHPDDIDGMVNLLRHFNWLSYVSQAISDWTKGDELLEKGKDIATRLHKAIQAKDIQTEERLVNELGALNIELTRVEDHFSRVLSDGSRWLESKVLLALFLMVLFVEGIGLTLTFLTGREIARIAEEKERLFDEAQKSLRTRDEFLSVASHELKTPLSSLGLQLHLIHKTLSDSPTEKSAEQIKALSAQSILSIKRLGGLVEELLDLTRSRRQNRNP